MSRPTPNPLDRRQPSPHRAGTVGAPVVDPREILLEKAGVTPEKQAEAVGRSFAKKVALLDAKETKFFAHEGEVMEQREVEAIGVQLKAAEAIDRMVGVNAPPSTRSVVVTHRLEWPEWYKPEGEPAIKVIEAESKEVGT